MSQLVQYMKTRRSSLSVVLEEPGPDEAQLRTILEIATRVPDHGRMAPWRIALWTPETRLKMHKELLNLLVQNSEIQNVEKKQKGTDKLLHAPCVLAVISTAHDYSKIPRWEQVLSTGAVCMNTLIAANSVGFEAQWLTAWYVYEEAANRILQLNEGERIAGIIHIGSTSTDKTERLRPEIDDLYTTI